MALASKKITDIFNKNTGGSKDAKSITDAKELEIKTKFDNGEHIEDNGMFTNLAPALYAVQQVADDIEEIRRFITSEITSISTSQANAITANTAKRDANCTTAQFVPFSDGITEGTSSTNPRNVFVAPANGTIKSIHIVSQNSLLEKGKGVPLAATFSKRTNGSSSLTPCAGVIMTTTGANTVMNGSFAAAGKAGTLAFNKGEQILVSLQLTTGVPAGNKNYYVTVVFQLDQSNLD
jgi:hypothetical protein